MSQYNTPASEAPPWWESTWALAKPEIVRPTLGMSFSGGERNQLFLNQGGEHFAILSGISGADDADDPRGFAYLDFDRDGFVDLALGSRGRPSFKLFRNNLGRGASESHSLGLRFVGGNRSSSPSKEFSNRGGYGAKVSFELGDGKILREHRAGEGWRNQNSATLLIGLGATTSIGKLRIQWPSGRIQVLENVPADKLVTLFEDADESADGSGFAMTEYRVQPKTDLPDPNADAPLAKSDFPLDVSPDAEFTMFTATATWCAACKRELTNIQRLRDSFGENQLAMIGVPIDPEDSQAMLEDYNTKSKPAYNLLSNLDLPTRAAFKGYVRAAMHTDVLPATVIVRRDGTPVYAEAGTPTLSKVRELLEHGDGLARRETWATAHAAPANVAASGGGLSRKALISGAIALLVLAALGFLRKSKGQPA